MMTRPYLGYVIHDIIFPFPSTSIICRTKTIRLLGKRARAAQHPRLFPFSFPVSASQVCLVLISAWNTGVCTCSHQWLSTVPTNNCPTSPSAAAATTAICPTTTATTATSPASASAGSLSWQRWTAHSQRRWLSADCGSIARNR